MPSRPWSLQLVQWRDAGSGATHDARVPLVPALPELAAALGLPRDCRFRSFRRAAAAKRTLEGAGTVAGLSPVCEILPAADARYWRTRAAESVAAALASMPPYPLTTRSEPRDHAR